MNIQITMASWRGYIGRWGIIIVSDFLTSNLHRVNYENRKEKIKYCYIHINKVIWNYGVSSRLFRPVGSSVRARWIRVASLALRIASRLVIIFSRGINCMSEAEWLGENTKCSATWVGSDLQLGLSKVLRCSLKRCLNWHLIACQRTCANY